MAIHIRAFMDEFKFTIMIKALKSTLLINIETLENYCRFILTIPKSSISLDEYLHLKQLVANKADELPVTSRAIELKDTHRWEHNYKEPQ